MESAERTRIETRSQGGAEDTATMADDWLRRPERRRRQRLLRATTVAVAGALAAVAVGLATTADDEPTRRTTAATLAPPAAPGGAHEQSAVTTAPQVVTTVAPAPAAAPDRSRPPGMTYRPLAVWPETLAELDRIQAAVDQGHQPWRDDAVEVARAYLLERGLPTPDMGPFRAGAAGAGSVDYTVAGRGGRVDLQQLLNGSIWYVTGSRTAALPGVQVDRRGSSLAVVVQSGTDGTLTAQARRAGGNWGAAQSRQAFAGGTWSATVATADASGQVVLQLRFEGGAGLAEIFLGQGGEGVRYSALDSESRLRVDGVGPVHIGMTLEEARAASGLAMPYREGPYCVGYQTDGPPAGLAFTAVEGSRRLDFVSVSEPSIATVSGIRVGSTVADVRRAYGDKLRGSVQDGWGKLVFRADDPSLDHVALAFLFSEGKVAGIWAGLRDVVERDEACA